MSTEPRFRTLASRVRKNPGYVDLQLIVEKEILLYRGSWLGRFVIHGGASLRL